MPSYPYAIFPKKGGVIAHRSFFGTNHDGHDLNLDDDTETTEIVMRHKPPGFVPIDQVVDPTIGEEALIEEIDERIEAERRIVSAMTLPQELQKRALRLTVIGRKEDRLGAACFTGEGRVVLVADYLLPFQAQRNFFEEALGSVPRIASFIKFPKRKRRY